MNEYRAANSLSMRGLEYGDVEFYHRLTGDPQVMRFITGKPHTEKQTRDEVPRLVERFAGDPVLGIWVFSTDDPAEPVGVGGLVPAGPHRFEIEIGYRVLPAFWRRGLGTAIARQLVAHAQLRSPRLVARVAQGNLASQRILERLGFTHHSSEPNDLGTNDLVFLRDE